MKMVIEGGRLICPANQLDTVSDICLVDDQIGNIGNIPNDFQADHTLDAKGKWVIPGGIDLCCRPQRPHPFGSKLTPEIETAFKSGFTTLCIPPDLEPHLDTPRSVTQWQPQLPAHYPILLPIGSLLDETQKTVADLVGLKEAGCIAFTTAQTPITDLGLLRHAYEYAASFGFLVIIQPQDPTLAQNGTAHDGFMATRLGLAGIPEAAETCALNNHLDLIEETGVSAHFTCLSSRGALEILKTAKKQLPITADVSIQQLFLTENDLSGFNAYCHVYPPLRSIRDQDALIEGVATGVIDAICSDHRPLHHLAKLAPFADTVPGMSTIDVFLSLGLSLVQKQKISLNRFIEAITLKPAQILGLNRGALSINQPANLCIFDPEPFWQVSDETLLSQGKNCAFKGWELPGRVTQMFHHGKLYDVR